MTGRDASRWKADRKVRLLLAMGICAGSVTVSTNALVVSAESEVGVAYISRNGNVEISAVPEFSEDCTETDFCASVGDAGTSVEVAAEVPEGWALVGWQACMPKNGTCDWVEICPGENPCNIVLNVPPNLDRQFGEPALPTQYRVLAAPDSYSSGIALSVVDPPQTLASTTALWVAGVSNDSRYAVYIDGYSGETWWQDRVLREEKLVGDFQNSQQVSLSPDGRYVFVSGRADLNPRPPAQTWDSQSEAFVSDAPVTPPSSLADGVCASSSDGRFQLRVEQQPNSNTVVTTIYDSQSDSSVFVTNRMFAGCGSNAPRYFYDISDDGTKALFVTSGTIEHVGPMPDFSHDYLGVYLVMVVDGVAKISALTGATMPRVDVSANFTSISATPDFQTILRANESRILSSTLQPSVESEVQSADIRSAMQVDAMAQSFSPSIVPRLLLGTRESSTPGTAPWKRLTLVKGGQGSGTISTEGSASSCGRTCLSFPSNTEAVLRATADSGSHFVGWSGDCSGTETCNLIMSTSRSVTATFDLVPTFALSVAKLGSGSGTVTSDVGGIDCGVTCSASFAKSTRVTLTAFATPGSRFAGWSGACSGTGTCIATMSVARSVTASFILEPVLSVAKEGSGSGTVTSNVGGINCGVTCSASYTTRTQVTLTASAAPGSRFAGWSGACKGTRTCRVTMSAARNVTATFNSL